MATRLPWEQEEARSIRAALTTFTALWSLAMSGLIPPNPRRPVPIGDESTTRQGEHSPLPYNHTTLCYDQAIRLAGQGKIEDACALFRLARETFSRCGEDEWVESCDTWIAALTHSSR